jgi:hypothetical protein
MSATARGVLSETGRSPELLLGWANAHPRSTNQE